MSKLPPRERFLQALRTAVSDGSLVKLTLGNYRGSDASLKNLFVRPVALKAGPHLGFVWRHANRDITKNHPPAEALRQLENLVGGEFRDAHLFTPAQTVQFQTAPNGRPRVKFQLADSAPPSSTDSHDHQKQRVIAPTTSWLQDLGVTNPEGQPRTGMAAKFRQVQRFAETMRHIFIDAGYVEDGDNSAEPRGRDGQALRVADMGSGKGYLTFAITELLGPTAAVTGIEQRAELVDTCNQVARSRGFDQLKFREGTIAATAGDLGELDALIALHACDTATDDALAAGIAAGANLLVVSPCCQKELRRQLTAPDVLAPALRHGIFQERQSEFVTDALRALLLEAQGYETKVFEFISTEHTAKNLMLVAWHPVDRPRRPSPAALKRALAFAQFYGIQDQALARHLGLTLGASE